MIVCLFGIVNLYSPTHNGTAHENIHIYNTCLTAIHFTHIPVSNVVTINTFKVFKNCIKSNTKKNVSIKNHFDPWLLAIYMYEEHIVSDLRKPLISILKKTFWRKYVTYNVLETLQLYGVGHTLWFLVAIYIHVLRTYCQWPKKTSQ